MSTVGSTTPVKIATAASILVILLSFAKTTLVELLFDMGFLVGGTITFELCLLFTCFGVEFVKGCVVTIFLLELCVIVSELSKI